MKVFTRKTLLESNQHNGNNDELHHVNPHSRTADNEEDNIDNKSQKTDNRSQRDKKLDSICNQIKIIKEWHEKYIQFFYLKEKR